MKRERKTANRGRRVMTRAQRTEARVAAFNELKDDLQAMGSVTRRCANFGHFTPAQAQLAHLTYREQHARLLRWLEVNKPRGT